MGAYRNQYLYQRVVQAKLFIDTAFGTRIDMDNISGEACFSKFHFLRLFKEIYGKTPHQYLTLVRMDEAVRLFKKHHSVSEVCLLVGFESISSFSGLFRRATGQSPAAFLKQETEKTHQMNERPLYFIPGCFAYQHGFMEDSNFEEAVV